MSEGVSTIYRRGPREETYAQAERRREIDRQARALWRTMGLVLIDPAEVTNDFERLAIEKEAIRKYGRRG